MNSENTPKEIVKSFIDLATIAKGLMDETQQPSVQKELAEMEGREVKVECFIGLVEVNHVLLQQLMQILVLQYHLPQIRRLQKYGYQKLVETPSTFAIFPI